MTTGESNKGELLILRVTSCRDSGVVLAGLSPEVGRFACFCHVSQRQVSRKGAPTYRPDLFQHIALEFVPGKAGGLPKCREVELLASYGGVASSPPLFQAACWMARFALANSMPGLATPRFFHACRAFLIRLLQNHACPEAHLTALGVAFLEEAGNLGNLNDEERVQCEVLLRMAFGGEIPSLPQENWQELWQWCRSRLLLAECREVEGEGRGRAP